MRSAVDGEGEPQTQSVDVAADENLHRVVERVGPPPRPSGDRVKFGARQQKWLLAFVAQLPSPLLASRMLGIHPNTIADRRKRDPVFKQAYEEAITLGREMTMSLAYEEAHGVGKSYVVTKDGGVIAVPKQRNDRIILALLNLHHARELNHFTHEHDVNGQVGFHAVNLTPEQYTRLDRKERRTLLALVDKATREPAVVDVTPPRLGSDHGE
jgi:hypothetical protein